MLFDLGKTVATPGALEALQRSGQAVSVFLCRHMNGDWGDVDFHDQKQNIVAVQEGGRILSSYRTLLGDALWVITEADRSSTCILLPEEY